MAKSILISPITTGASTIRNSISMSAHHATVILVQSDHYQEMLLSSAFLSMNFSVRRARKDYPLLHELKTIQSTVRGRILICADIVRIAQERMLWPHFAAAVRAIIGDAELIATHSQQLQPSVLIRSWAKKHGAYDMLGRVSHIRLLQSIQPFIDAVQKLFATDPDVRRVGEYIQGMHGVLEDSADEYGSYQHTWYRLHGVGQSPFSMASDMIDAGKVIVRDRRYRLKLYPNCFIGSEAVKWLSDQFMISATQAESVGLLMQKLGIFYHVTKDQPFRNGEFFYRYSANINGGRHVDLDRIIEESRLLRGFDVQDRTWRGMRFPKSFVGVEAASWMSSFYGLTANEAVSVGQAMQDVYHFRHVVDDRDFVDYEYYYRMTMDN
jgi:hypothetical protein